ncbi:hypothetical protein CLAFUW4_05039 [Fulvia fulva]|uniref:Uncharacterized protein n=1 Tax=Passalora fulva TaxID=5499 RepID=A0A9Q8UU72_PASFU|nr:uncharacterized protein CLAFUR5_11868 [Fulvia fulva]KAK4626266.1 hypothetical protein CLAFUR4_05025 [Fulvia fulva]KAK4628316.1 hypothetical protein CLAFUR0_05029 [Fulvia fulva]UJO22583.1 hypothetical protein CLAFUR5_11868 [Fulvia fulva]WPV13189.1 hypothetical protein CLAFUW4_05039 [Fulvia fulva]WPV28689.1 hypothetical protein CLAFUW7_05033 [Fulvia fulva]
MLLDHLTDAADYHTYHTAMSSNFFSQSPTVVLPPQAPNQYFVNNHYGGANGTAPAVNGISPNGLSNSAPFTPTASTPASSLAGRKRSRGDIYTEDGDGEDERLDGSTATPIEEDLVKPRGKPVYGPGMTVLYPEDPGYAMAAASQSGTWVEEGAERRPFQLAHAKRPSVTSRKSQRVDSKAAGPDDLAQLVLPASMREACAEPLIDEATRVLGISWARMDSTEALQINKRAYSKWIQNHYPCLKNVDVWFESSSIPGYLVHGLNAYNGQHEYYIFSHDLTEARLVTNEPSQLLPRLQMLPALHLAAPGGHIRAETDPITAAQNEANDIQADMMAMHGPREPVGICTAHAMELD